MQKCITFSSSDAADEPHLGPRSACEAQVPVTGGQRVGEKGVTDRCRHKEVC